MSKVSQLTIAAFGLTKSVCYSLGETREVLIEFGDVVYRRVVRARALLRCATPANQRDYIHVTSLSKGEK